MALHPFYDVLHHYTNYTIDYSLTVLFEQEKTKAAINLQEKNRNLIAATG